jgi:photosystem II stability/assembly factor-like uncharacterized protein
LTGAGFREGGKKEVLFLKKKNKKNFCSFPPGDLQTSRVKVIKVFCAAFFQKSGFLLFLLLPHLSLAQVIDPAATPLNQPARMTSLASTGLFTSVALAGNRLVAAGERGRIVWSDDDGQNWRQARTPTGVTLTNIRFVSSREGWAIGQMGVILHTLDGGEDWRLQYDGIRANQALVAAAKADLSAGGASPLNTANLQAAQQFAGGGPNAPLLALLPLSPGHVIVAGAFGMAFTTADSGAAWQPIFDRIPNPNGLHIYSIVRDGGATYFAGEQGMLLRLGADHRFTTLNTPFQGTFFGALITPGKALLLFGLQGTVLRSADAGQTWHAFQAADGAGVDCGIVLRNGDILLGDEAGNLLLSQDDGLSFRAIPAGGPVTALAQAPGGAIITASPFGLARMAPIAGS